MKQPIKPNVLMNLTALFHRKQWDISDVGGQSMGLFEKFCERLRLFTSEEQEMIIEITEDFIRVGLQEYLEKFFESFILLGDQFFDDNEKIYVLPLVDPYVPKGRGNKVLRGKSKSADFLHYMLDASEYRWLSNKIVTNISVKKLLKEFDVKTSTLVLVDDFVGTGKTAADVCKIFLQENFINGSITSDKIKVVSIAAQKHGIKYVKDETHINVISNILVPKGISDKFMMPDLPLKLNQMKDIEAKLLISSSSDYHLGFGQSEAMITFLNKTPNNTFPVYWLETKTKIAPFPRYKKYDI